MIEISFKKCHSATPPLTTRSTPSSQSATELKASSEQEVLVQRLVHFMRTDYKKHVSLRELSEQKILESAYADERILREFLVHAGLGGLPTSPIPHEEFFEDETRTKPQNGKVLSDLVEEHYASCTKGSLTISQLKEYLLNYLSKLAARSVGKDTRVSAGARFHAPDHDVKEILLENERRASKEIHAFNCRPRWHREKMQS